MVSAKSKGGNLGSVGFAELPDKFVSTINTQRTFFADKVSSNSIIVSVVFFVIQVALLGVSFTKLPPHIPLFYSMPWGEQILAPVMLVWILPVINIVTIVLNFVLTLALSKNFEFLSRTLAIFTVVFSFSSFWVIFKIITLLI